MTRKRLTILIIAIAIVGCLAAFLFLYDDWGDTEKAEKIVEEDTEVPAVIEQPPVSLLISCVGDVMVHKSQIPSQYDSAADIYDYNNNFIYIRKYIENSDLALCNLETTFGGKPYAGYPLFSAPDELAAALKTAGFDIAMTANNHMMDRGIIGLKRTIDVLQGSGLHATGGRQEETQPRYAIFDVKGVKVGVAAYTYASSSASGALLINGSSVSNDASALINYFRYSHIDEDLKNIKETVKEARDAGADIMIVYYHWGEEYQLKSNTWQRYIAEKTVNDMDVDMIFGSHPHTLQEAVFITNEETGKKAPVFYSMGNFISNQRVETLNNRYTEIGIIAQVRLEYDINNKEISSISMDAIPVWVEKYRVSGRDIYAVIPLDDELDANETLAVSGNLRRAQRAWEDANGILGID